jgi:hypothetical protein
LISGIASSTKPTILRTMPRKKKCGKTFQKKKTEQSGLPLDDQDGNYSSIDGEYDDDDTDEPRRDSQPAQQRIGTQVCVSSQSGNTGDATSQSEHAGVYSQGGDRSVNVGTLAKSEVSVCV